jgi:hypothetical protein
LLHASEAMSRPSPAARRRARRVIAEADGSRAREPELAVRATQVNAARGRSRQAPRAWGGGEGGGEGGGREEEP